MDKLTLQGALASVNSLLVELGLVAAAFATVRHWGAPCPLLFQWGVGILLLGTGLFISTLIFRRGGVTPGPRAASNAAHARVAAVLATPTLLTASACLAISCLV